MPMPPSHRLSFALLVALAGAGCAGGDDGSPSTGGGGSSGGNVGFGGAQDIGQFRGILEAGQLPGDATLDASGFFAEHYSEQPPPDCGQDLCIASMVAVGRDWTSGDDQAVLQIGLTTPHSPEDFERRPLDLIAVVDTSGSMVDGDRIGYARQGLHELVDALGEGDRIALVTYDSGVRQLSGLVGSESADVLHGQIDELYAAGSTNLYAGLEMGLQLGLEQLSQERQSRVVLLSDGIPTAGITDDASIMAMAERYMSDGIGLTTIGVGLDFHVELMRGLAERGAGNFYFLEDAQAIAEVFREELDYFVTPIAYDVEISVDAASGWTLGEVIGSRYWSGSSQSGSVTLPAAYLASRVSDEPSEGEGRRGAGGAIFVELHPTSGSAWENAGELAARVSLRYRLPGGTQAAAQSADLAAGQPTGSDPWLSHESMAEHYAMYNMFRGLRAATRMADWSAYDCALTTLDLLDQKAANWQLEAADPDIDADRELIAMFRQNLIAYGARGVDGDYGQCKSYDDMGGYDGYYDDPYYDDYHGCSAGRSSSQGLSVVMVALLAAVRWRRRRETRMHPRPCATP